MSTRYQVKWTNTEGTHYGIYLDRDSILNKRQYKGVPKGTAVVEDAILPVLHTVPEEMLVDVDLKYGGEYDQYVEADYKKAAALSSRLKGVVVGKLFSIGVADGAAVYIVTAVHGYRCDVEWRGYGGGDRYFDHTYFGWGRKNVLNSVVKPHVSWDEFCSKTFGRKTKTA